VFSVWCGRGAEVRNKTAAAIGISHGAFLSIHTPTGAGMCRVHAKAHQAKARWMMIFCTSLVPS
jgi:hypothetical protein